MARTRVALWGLMMIASTATGLLWTAAPAAAHATVVSSVPADGTRLETSPAGLTFDLSEPVTLVDGSAQLIDVDGTRYPLASQHLEAGRQRIVLPLSEKLPDGAYLATARVVSADTHVVSLSIRFTVGSVTEPAQWSQVDDASAVGRAVLLPLKIVVYLGTIGSAGLLLAARWAWPGIQATHRFRIVYRIGAALLILGLLGRLAVLAIEQAGSVADTSWQAATAIAGTPFGIALLVAGVLSLVAPLRPAVLGLPQAATAIAAVTLGGHGGSSVWSFLVTSVHIYAVAVWLGGLTLIALVHRSVPQRWHRIAVAHVGLAAGAGVALAVLQIRPLAALTTTSYGVTLLVKVSLVTAAVAVGYLVNRAARTHMPGRVVLVETVLAVLIVGVTSSLSSLTPARASYTTNVAVRLDFGGPDVLDVDIDTVRRGRQVVTVRDPGSSPGAEVSLELSSAQANVARLPVELSHDRAVDDTVTWRSTGLIVPAPGRWKATIRFDNGSGPKLASFFYQVL